MTTRVQARIPSSTHLHEGDQEVNSLSFHSCCVSQWDSNVRRVCVSAHKSVSSEPEELAAPVTRSRRVTRDASLIPHVSSLLCSFFLFPLDVFFSSLVSCFDPGLLCEAFIYLIVLRFLFLFLGRSCISGRTSGN